MSLPFYVSYVALWILVIVQSLLLLGVVRLVYQLQGSATAGKQLQNGQEVPRFSTVDLTGAPVRSADFAGRLTALLFVSPTCPSCMTTLDELDALRQKARGNVVVICGAGHADCSQLAERYRLGVPTVADEDGELARRFGIPGTPTAVLINEQNRIQSYGQPKHGEELAALFTRASEIEIVRMTEDGHQGRARSQAAGSRAE